MFDWPLDWFSLVIVIGAFTLALKAFNRTDHLRARLDALESAQAKATAIPIRFLFRRRTAPPAVPAVSPQSRRIAGLAFLTF